MANEATVIELGALNGKPVRKSVLDGTGIEKYTLMEISGAAINYVKASVGTGTAWGGIASAEKVASDGSTTLAVFTDGVFDLTAAGTINAGACFCLSGANKIRAAVEADFPTGAVGGICEEPATDGAVVRCRLRGY